VTVTRVGFDSVQVSAGLTATLDLPVGWAEGDWAYVALHGDTANEAAGPTDGTTWTDYITTLSGNTSLHVFRRQLTASEPASFTFGRDDVTNDNFTAVMLVYRGADAELPNDPHVAVTTQTSTGVTTATIDVRTAQNLLVNILGIGGSQTVTGRPSGWDPVVEEDGFNPGLSVVEMVQAAAGTSDDPAWTVSASQTLKSVLFAIRPAPVPPIYSTGLQNATAGTNVDNAGGNAWSTPDSLDASDNTRATATANEAVATDFLRAAAFDFSAVPDAADVVGVLAVVERGRAGGTTGDVRDSSLRLVDETGTQVGDNKAATELWNATSEPLQLYGDIEDLWGLSPGTLAPADVRDADFGFALAVEGVGTGANRSARVDHWRGAIYYEMPTYAVAVAATIQFTGAVTAEASDPAPEPEPDAATPHAGSGGYVPLDRERRRREDEAWEKAMGRGPREQPVLRTAERDIVRTPLLELQDELPAVDVEDEEILLEMLALGLLE
jgi:hypothetical protein